MAPEDEPRMASGESVDFCVVGHVTRDLVRPPRGPSRWQPGGSAWYASAALSRLGARVCLVTRVAAADEPMLDPLNRAGVRMRLLPAERTTTFENDYAAPDRVQRLHAMAPPFVERDLAELQAAVWLLGPLTPDEIGEALVHSLAGCGGALAADLQGWLRGIDEGRIVEQPRPGWQRVVGHLNIVKASHREAGLLTGASTPSDAAVSLRGLGPAEVLVTCGEQGAVVAHGGGCEPVRARLADPVVDVTGCGDTFLAAYLWARHGGTPPPGAAAFAAAAAASKAERDGPLAEDAAAVRRRMDRVRS